MFTPSRDEVRRFFCNAWQKHAARLPLAGAEIAAADIAARHPEYHDLLADPEALQREWTPEAGAMKSAAALTDSMTAQALPCVTAAPALGSSTKTRSLISF